MVILVGMTAKCSGVHKPYSYPPVSVTLGKLNHYLFLAASQVHFMSVFYALLHYVKWMHIMTYIYPILFP